MKKLFLPLFMIASVYAASQNGKNMDKDVIAFFNSKYQEPVIEEPSTLERFGFPGITIYTVYERKQLVQDPLIPDKWFMTSKRQFFRSGEFDKLLIAEKLTPSSEGEALNYAIELVIDKYHAFYAIVENSPYSKLIPQKYLIEKYYPVISTNSGKYSITVFFYYPDDRRNYLISMYRNKLVEFKVKFDGFNYSVEIINESAQ